MCPHFKDTSINRTLLSVPNASFVYSTAPEMRTPHYSGHSNGVRLETISTVPQILDHMSLVPEQSRVAVYVRKTLAKKRRSNESSKKGKSEEIDGGSKGLKVAGGGGVKRAETEVQSPFLHDGLSLKDLVLLGEIIDKLNPATEHQVRSNLLMQELALSLSLSLSLSHRV